MLYVGSIGRMCCKLHDVMTVCGIYCTCSVMYIAVVEICRR